MTAGRVIGVGDAMPWDVPEEYAQYLEFTRGQTIVLGRRSFEIFGPELTTEHAVVLTRSPAGFDPTITDAQVHTARSLEEAGRVAVGLGKRVFCGGGGEVYRQALPLAAAMLLSFIKDEYVDHEAIERGPATGFPEWDAAAWRVAEERGESRFRFVRYERRR